MLLRAIGIKGGAIILLALAVALCWNRWGYWKDKYGILSGEAAIVLDVTRKASDNPKLKWEGVSAQIEELDASLTGWKSTAQLQSDTIDQMGRDTERLRAENAALAKKVAALTAKRDRLIRQLEDDAMEPGDRADCWAQIREADDALNQLYKEGF